MLMIDYLSSFQLFFIQDFDTDAVQISYSKNGAFQKSCVPEIL